MAGPPERPLDWPTRDPLSHRRAATPDAVGLVDAGRDRRWTYRELDRWADLLADRIERLSRQADRSGDADDAARIAVLSGTRPAVFPLLFGALRAGRSVVGLNARLADPGVRDRVDRTDPGLVVCGADTESLAAGATDGLPVASLDPPDSDDVAALLPDVDPAATDPGRSPPDGAGEDGRPERDRLERNREAVVLFTSGTTGEPKGVRLTVGNLVASAVASAFRLGVVPGDRWLVCLPTYHMGGLAPGIRATLYGTTAVVQRGFDADRTARILDERSITGVSLVPTALERLLDAGWSPGEALRFVLLGGAPAPRSLVERCRERGVPVCPTYGLTETASQVATVRPGAAAEHPESVGQPLAFTDLVVLDAEGDPCPPGETGEIVVDGPTVAPGYLDPDRTDGAFGPRGLHTGDLGYRDADGRLWVTGRLDDRIITGGETVDPEAVAAVLRDHPDVREAAVVGVDDPEWGQQVSAAVVSVDEREAVDVADLEAACRDRLADFEVPRRWVAVDELPRTPSGTVDREAVRERIREGHDAGS